MLIQTQTHMTDNAYNSKPKHLHQGAKAQAGLICQNAGAQKPKGTQLQITNGERGSATAATLLAMLHSLGTMGSLHVIIDCTCTKAHRQDLLSIAQQPEHIAAKGIVTLAARACTPKCHQLVQTSGPECLVTINQSNRCSPVTYGPTNQCLVFTPSGQSTIRRSQEKQRMGTYNCYSDLSHTYTCCSSFAQERQQGKLS